MNAKTEQYALAVGGEIDPAVRAQALAMLTDFSGKLRSRDNPYIRFAETPTHFARLFLLDGDPEYPLRMFFCADIDGGLDDYLESLRGASGAGMDRLFKLWKGYPDEGAANATAFRRFIKDRALPVQAFYDAYRGNSVKSVENALEVRSRVQDFIDREYAKGLASKTPAEVREAILKFLVSSQQEIVPGYLPKFTVKEFVRYAPKWQLVPIALVASVIGIEAAIALSPILLPLYLLLRKHERNDKKAYELLKLGVYGLRYPTATRFDEPFKNQMTHVVEVKEGSFRRNLLKAFLWLIDNARYVVEPGQLGGIPTVHMARWFFIDGERRLLFNSQFDVDWESYMSDFIDGLPWGLNMVWTHTMRYPPTKNVFGAGGADINGFKQFILENQFPTQVWYCAYPDRSVNNIVNALRFRESIARDDMTEAQIVEWLERLGRDVIGQPRMDRERAETPEEPHFREQWPDMQGLVLRGYAQLKHCCYLFLTFNDAARARQWIADTLPSITAADTHTKSISTVVNLAFTHEGLRSLALDADALSTFPVEFQEGMVHPDRSLELGDVGDGSPDKWTVGGDPSRLHAVLVIFGADREAVEQARAEHAGRATQVGQMDVLVEYGMNFEHGREHFGFRDGISNPAVAGGGVEAKPGQVTVRAGEFVLGYLDEYGSLPRSPSVYASLDPQNLLPVHSIDPGRKDLGRNGTYLVFRKLQQDVGAFWRYFKEQSSNEQEMILLASKCVGRWPSGCPLSLSRERDDPALAADPARVDAFSYFFDDLEGYGCPAGAHVRRANPRDDIIVNKPKAETVTRRHRIRRRASSYGTPLPPFSTEDDGQERGLLFLCTNADIKRQFELVNRWGTDETFNGLEDRDPTIGDVGNRRGSGGMLIPGKPVRRRLLRMERFVTTRGGGYFFLPSRRALQFIAQSGG